MTETENVTTPTQAAGTTRRGFSAPKDSAPNEAKCDNCAEATQPFFQSTAHRSSSANNPGQRGSRRLRYLPTALDTGASLAAWTLAHLGFAGGSNTEQTAFVAAGATLTMLILFHRSGLYLARVTAVRLEELTRVLRAVTVVSLAWYIIGLVTELNVGFVTSLTAGVLGLAAVFVCRSTFRAWLLSQRAQGAYRRDVIVIGTNAEAASLVDLLDQHSELGFSVAAVLGRRQEAEAHGLSELWAGETDAASLEYHSKHLTGALIATTALDGQELNRVSRILFDSGVHVYLSSRLVGIASHRLSSQSIAYEPFTYLERLQLAKWQTIVKRGFDMAIAPILLVLSAPLMAVLAVVVKMEDRGPAFFRQERVGRDGVPFTMLKLRTMVVDAEQHLESLREEANERGGPLFKLDHDPRFTRVGRIMDVTSINELPQLWNVLRGDMSIVGPRPALPREHERFDEALRARTVVRPGITGLWQIEARDNPSFDAYRRFDLHYVENWSVSLDFAILAATAEAVLARAVKTAVKNRSKGGLYGRY
jgi:exopolysaccharide biosynthesis polyprenyl glycosylphosphotransferase